MNEETTLEATPEEVTPEPTTFSDADLDAVRAEFPDFDLATELANPRFARLTSPEVGLSVTEAYYLLHRREIREGDARRAAQDATEKLTAAILSGSRRPEEAGMRGVQNPPAAFDYRRATPAEREDLKRRIRHAAAMGQKIYPGR